MQIRRRADGYDLLKNICGMPADLDKLEMRVEGLCKDSSYAVILIECNPVEAEE